jgi:hypothetical protein
MAISQQSLSYKQTKGYADQTLLYIQFLCALSENQWFWCVLKCLI